MKKKTDEFEEFKMDYVNNKIDFILKHEYYKKSIYKWDYLKVHLIFETDTNIFYYSNAILAFTSSTSLYDTYIIFIDNRLLGRNDDLVNMLFYHEIAHIVLNHRFKRKSIYLEYRADLFAYKLFKERNKNYNKNTFINMMKKTIPLYKEFYKKDLDNKSLETLMKRIAYIEKHG